MLNLQTIMQIDAMFIMQTPRKKPPSSHFATHDAYIGGVNLKIGSLVLVPHLILKN